MAPRCPLNRTKISARFRLSSALKGKIACLNYRVSIVAEAVNKQTNLQNERSLRAAQVVNGAF
jgi:hypothetical protein